MKQRKAFPRQQMSPNKTQNPSPIQRENLHIRMLSAGSGFRVKVQSQASSGQTLWFEQSTDYQPLMCLFKRTCETTQSIYKTPKEPKTPNPTKPESHHLRMLSAGLGFRVRVPSQASSGQTLWFRFKGFRSSGIVLCVVRVHMG